MRNIDQWNNWESRNKPLHLESTDVQQGCQDNPVGERPAFWTNGAMTTVQQHTKNEAGTLPYTTHKKLTQKGS